MFLQFYKDRLPWKEHVTNIDSPFMKLLQIEKLFFITKKIKDVRMGNKLTLTNFVMNEDSIEINDGVSQS